MKKLQVILILSLVFFASLSTYGSVKIERISANANWFAQLDCDQFHQSIVGESLKSKLSEFEIEKRLENFAIIFGFNPIKDLNYIMLYGQGRDRDKAVLIIEGNFNKERLLSLVEMNSGFKEIAYNNITIQQWSEKNNIVPQGTEGKMMYGCFYSDDLIMLSSGLSALEDAIDVMKGTKESTSHEIFKDPLLTDSNTFLHMAALDIAQLVGDEPNAAILKQTEHIIIGIGQDSENLFASVKLKANSQETAQNISKLIDGILALLSLAGNEQPELAKIGQMIKVTTDSDKIQIRMELKPELIQQTIENLTGKI